MLLRSTLLAGAFLLAGPLHAANTEAAAEVAGAEAEAAAGTPGDIVVTARRRSESVQDVPLAVSVVGSAQLDATGTYGFARLAQLQPSVQFIASNPRNSSITIRGLGSPFGLTNDGIDQGVGFYIDQVYYSRPASASFDFVDVDRIEILRGPQGTLYGKNTTAGAIVITTKPPSFTPEGQIELTGGNYDFLQAKGSVSGPLVDGKLAARVGVAVTQRDGTIFNRATGRHINDLDNLGVRASLLWTPTDTLSITLQGDVAHQNPDCCGQLFVRVAPTLRAANRQFDSLAAAAGYVVPSRDPFDRIADLDGPLQSKQDFGGASLRVEWDLGGPTLTSVSAWRFWHWRPLNDRDFIGLPITTVSSNNSDQRQITQEFRLASSGSNKLDYVVGLFGYRQVIDTNSLQAQGASASLFLLGPAATNLPSILNGLSSQALIHYENNSLAAFGQLTWRITNRLRLQPGLRLNYDEKQASYNQRVTGGLVNPTPAQLALQRGVLAPALYRANFSDTNVSGDVNLSYDVADDVLAYATYAKSFKPGGVNLSGLPADAAGNPILSAAVIKPERVDHYEFGLKTQFLDRRATVNLSVFESDIANYQATVQNGALGVIRGYLANAKKVRSRGVELETRFQPTKQLGLYASGTYTDAEYVRFPDAPLPIELTGGPATGPQSIDISGRRLPGVSKWSASFGGQLDLPTARDDNAFYVGVDGNYRSSFSSNPTPSRYTNIAGYALINFRAGYRTGSGWNAFAWTRNAFNKHYFDFLSVQPGNTGLIVGQPGDPRTYGLTVSRSF